MPRPISPDSDSTQSLPDYSVNETEECELMTEYTTEYTTELEFAIDLMNFVVQENHLQYQNLMHLIWLWPQSRSKFDYVMKHLVKLNLKKHTSNAYIMIAKHVNLDCDKPSYEEFKYFSNFASFEVEQVYTNDYSFLFYCIMMAQMATVAYSRGMSRAPNFAIMLMCRTFRNLQEKSFISRNPWYGMRAMAQEAISLLEQEIINKL